MKTTTHSKNYSVIIVMLCLFMFNIANAQPKPPTGFEWKEVPELTDEFNRWDRSKWQKPLWNYGVPVQMIARNSGVTDGKLWIKSSLDNSSQRWFQTSRVMSNAQIKFPFYTESKILNSNISAYNTFWLNNGNINNRDEIDVIENNSNPSCGCQPNFPWQMNSQYFHVVNGDTKRNTGNFDNRKLPANNPGRGVRWNQGYHVFGVLMLDSRNIQFYLDGVPAGKVRSARDFTRNMNIIWDLWTADFSWLGGLARKNNLNNDAINTMYVDWVHTYKLVEAGLSVEEDNLKTISMYPSPAKDILNIKELEENTDILIYDYTGRRLLETKANANITTINVSNLPTGAYFVKVEGYKVKRLIVE